VSRINRIEVDGFRNLKGIEIDFDPGINLIVGENGAGKSNLLEAIYYLLYLRSYRNATEAELVNLESEGFSLKGFGDEDRVEVRVRNGTKRVFRNGIERHRFHDYYGWLDGVVFSLSDILIVRGSPSLRRDWLNSLLARCDANYRLLLNEYRSILKQRNQLLLQERYGPELEAWSERLVEVGSKVYQIRYQTFPRIKEWFQALAHQLNLPLEISYHPVTSPERFWPDLRRSASRERELRLTVVGPHRDEIGITKAGQDIRAYGSEGEERLAGIILRLVEAEMIKARKDPILLLDEPFIEIDKHNQERLKSLLANKGQLILATTTPDWQGKTVRLKGGRVEATD